jgi:hypothetical protein
MHQQINLADVDVDGAVREAHADAVEQLERAGDTRLSFLRKAGLAGGAVLGGGALLGALVPGTALAAGRPPSSFGAGDVGILNYALTLEYLESTFYNQAYTNLYASAPAQVKAFLTTTKADEAAHVAALKGALGSKAIAKPKFDFGKAVTSLPTFEATAYVLENTGVAAYSGQAFNIKDPKVLDRHRRSASCRFDRHDHRHGDREERPLRHRRDRRADPRRCHGDEVHRQLTPGDFFASAGVSCGAVVAEKSLLPRKPGASHAPNHDIHKTTQGDLPWDSITHSISCCC